MASRFDEVTCFCALFAGHVQKAQEIEQELNKLIYENMKSEVINMPTKKRKKTTKNAHLVGQPVMVVLKDGSYYIGIMDRMEKDAVTLSGIRPEMRLPESIADSQDRAQISGFLSSLFGGLGGLSGAAGGEGGGGGPGLFEMFGKMIPHIQVGMNMIKTIMPLIGMFKI